MTKGKDLVELGFVRIDKKHLDRLRSGALSLNPLPPSFPSSSEYIGGEPAKHIKNHSFTTISNIMWNGAIYRRLHYLYQTPFIGAYISDRDYLKLLSNLRYYLESPLTFTEASQTKFAVQNNAGKLPIIGLLAGDIKIYFYDENSELEVKNNWLKRLDRINWDSLYITYFCNPYASKLEQTESLAEFERFEFDFKVAFTATPCSQFNSAIHLTDYGKKDLDLIVASAKAIDITAWLNKTYGIDLQKYLINDN